VLVRLATLLPIGVLAALAWEILPATAFGIDQATPLAARPASLAAPNSGFRSTAAATPAAARPPAVLPTPESPPLVSDGIVSRPVGAFIGAEPAAAFVVGVCITVDECPAGADVATVVALARTFTAGAADGLGPALGEPAELTGAGGADFLATGAASLSAPQ